MPRQEWGHFNSIKSISLAPTPTSYWENLPQGEIQASPWMNLPPLPPTVQSPTERATGPPPLQAGPTRRTSSHLPPELGKPTGPCSHCDASVSTAEVWSHLPLAQALLSCKGRSRPPAPGSPPRLCWCCCYVPGASFGPWRSGPRSHCVLREGRPVWSSELAFACSDLQTRDRLSDRTS